MKGTFNKTLAIALIMSSVSGAYAWPTMPTMQGTKEVAGRFAGQVGRFAGEHSQSFWNFVKKHPYAFGIPAVILACELGVRGYNKLTGKQDNGVNTPSRFAKNHPYMAGAAGLAFVGATVDANTTGYMAKGVAMAKPYAAKACGKLSEGASKVASYATETAKAHPTATKAVAGVAGAAVVGAVTYKAVGMIKGKKADATPVVVNKSLLVDALNATTLSQKGTFNCGITYSFDENLVNVCSSVLNPDELKTLNVSIKAFNACSTRDKGGKQTLGRIIRPLLVKANGLLS